MGLLNYLICVWSYINPSFEQIKVWDAQEQKCVRALMGHNGSIKSLSCHPINQGKLMSFSVICIEAPFSSIIPHWQNEKDYDCFSSLAFWSIYLYKLWWFTELVVSGSRDGSFALWDTRCSKNTYQKLSMS